MKQPHPNPLYELWLEQAIKDPEADYDPGAVRREIETRSKAAVRYAWAIPDERALSIIAEYGPIVEVGAGKGYWAAQLKARGVDIIAYDANPPTRASGNSYCEPGAFTEVKKGLPPVLMFHPGRALFLCWPDYNTSFAFDCLSQYKGATVIFVGEGPGGCTGDSAFFDKLESEYECLGDYSIPRWSMIRDYLSIWRRR